jgi:hypothetical protein
MVNISELERIIHIIQFVKAGIVLLRRSLVVVVKVSGGIIVSPCLVDFIGAGKLPVSFVSRGKPIGHTYTKRPSDRLLVKVGIKNSLLRVLMRLCTV